MVTSSANTVDGYIAELDPQRAELEHLNLGKSCIRFRKLDDLPLDVIQTILQLTAERLQSE